MAKYAAKGTLLKYESATAPSVWTTIPGVQDFDLPLVGTKDEIDVTSHDSAGNYEETVLGIARTNAITIPMVWDGANVTHALIVTRAKADTITNFQCTAKDTKVYTFAGYFKGINIGMPVNGAQVAQVELKISGEVTVA